MDWRRIIVAFVVAGFGLGAPVPALSQSALGLKGTVDAEEPPAGQLSETSLEANPIEAAPPEPRRRRAEADPYAPQGIGNAGIRFYPSITAGTVYSSNVTNANSNPQSDIGLRLRPDLRVESNWIRHSLNAGVSGDFTRYRDHEELSTGTLNVFQRLRLDVRKHTTANIETSYTLDDGGDTDPTEHTLSGSAALTQDFGAVTTTLKAGVSDHLFSDTTSAGVTQDNSDLDYYEPSLSLRASFGDGEVMRPFVEAGYSPRIHAQSVDRNGIRRDSQGLSLTAGIEMNDDPLWAGELGLTYLHRNYEDASIRTANTLGLSGSLTWNPTELTRVVMETGTAIKEASGTGSSPTPTWTASVDVTQAIRDNVDLTAGLGVEIEDFGSSVDKTYDASLGLSWTFNPIMAWTAAYDLTWLDSGTSGSSYVEHRISTGLTLSR